VRRLNALAFFLATVAAVQSALPASAESTLRSDSQASSQGAQWSMFKHGASRTGRTRIIGPQSSDLAWQQLLKGFCMQAPLAIGGDGTIYFGDYCGMLTALAPDGSLKWSYSNFAVYIRSAPTIGNNGRLHIGALAGPTFPGWGGLFAFGS
jgi:outer membrane protein assembly factor BamB